MSFYLFLCLFNCKCKVDGNGIVLDNLISLHFIELHVGHFIILFFQVHPCGQYRKNTVVGILQAEHDLAPLFRIQLISWHIIILHTFHLVSGTWNLHLKCVVFLNYTKAIHRLDRLVSGLLILARSASQADVFRQQVKLLCFSSFIIFFCE